MKAKLISALVVLFVLTLSINCFAQIGRMNAQERMRRILEELKNRLELTELQYAQVDSLLKLQNDEIEKLRESNNGDRVSMRSAFIELREKYNRIIESLLNEKQKKEYAKYLEERRQRMQGMNRD